MNLLLAAAATPAHAALDPIAFFTGRTHGDGRLKIILSPSKAIRVDSQGVAEKDGTLVLRQEIAEGDKPHRTRTWKLRRTGPSSFAGMLSDASGPVRVEQSGDTIRIRYKDRDNLDFDQTLVPDGPRIVRNRTTIRRFGIIVARIDERIRKLD